MGYRGKLAERQRARELRLEGFTYDEIAGELGVSKGSISKWVRDLPAPPRQRRRSSTARPSSLRLHKLAQIEALQDAGRSRVGRLSDRDLLIAGTALYAGEGDKTGGMVSFAHSAPRMIQLFLTWLRTQFVIDEHRLRSRLHLHHGLDLREAVAYWSMLTSIPEHQFTKPYRATPDPTYRSVKHPMGCLSVRYSDVTVMRTVMGLVEALLSCADADPG